MGKKFSSTISKIEEFVLGYSIIFMFVILVGSVISRTLFNKSWTFAEEVGQALTIVVTFIGIGYGARKAKHITMSAIFDLVPKKYQKIMMLIISAGTSIGMLYLAYIAFDYTMMVKQYGRFTPALQIPMYLILIVIPIGFFLGAVEYARTFFINLKSEDVYVSSEKRTDEIEEDLVSDGNVLATDNKGFAKEKEGLL